MSEPLIGLPSSVPLPLPYWDCSRVAMTLSSSARPGFSGAGRTIPFFRKSSFLWTSNDRPSTPSNFAAPLASRTLICVLRAPNSAASARLDVQIASPGRRDQANRRPWLGHGQKCRDDLSPGRTQPSRLMGPERKPARQYSQPIQNDPNQDPRRELYRDSAG